MENKMKILVREINQYFKAELIETSRLVKYQKLVGSNLIQDFKRVMSAKIGKSQTKMVDLMAKGISQIIDSTVQQIRDILEKPRKTDLSKFMCEIIIPNIMARKTIEAKRTEMIISMRKTGNIDKSDIKTFYKIYSLFIDSTNADQQIFQNKNSQKNQKIKSMLMSLKKLMGSPEKLEEVVQKKQDTYSINLDIKVILSKVSEILMGSQAGIKLKNLLDSAQNKKWLGPRMYKMIKELNWNGEEIKMLIDGLKRVDLEMYNFRSDIKILKRVIKKISYNLRRVIPKKKQADDIKNNKVNAENEITKRNDNFVAQQVNKKSVQELFLPDLMQIEKCIGDDDLMCSGEQFASDSDIEQFLEKDKLGNMFDRLCQQQKFNLKTY